MARPLKSGWRCDLRAGGDCDGACGVAAAGGGGGGTVDAFLAAAPPPGTQAGPWLERGAGGFYVAALDRTNAFDEAAATLARWRARWPEAGRFCDQRERTSKLLRRSKNEGDAALKEGRFAAALEAYGYALRVDGKHPRVFYNRGLTFMALKRYADATADFGYALESQAHYPKASLGRARCYANLGRLDDAAVMYRKYLREAPKMDAAAADELKRVERARHAQSHHDHARAHAQRHRAGTHAARPRRAAAPPAPAPLRGAPARGTHYATLGVNYEATPAQLKKKFRELALKFHPDKNKTRTAEERFKKINAAYEVLSDPARRRDYDLTLQPERPRTNADGYWQGSY